MIKGSRNGHDWIPIIVQDPKPIYLKINEKIMPFDNNLLMRKYKNDHLKQ